jgi:prepilin peptidase CpaA
MVCSALHDLATRTIPNGLTLTVAGTALLAAAGQGHLLGSILAAGFVLACAALCWRRGWMGGGDVKLLGAITLAVPLAGLPALIAAVAISGGILGLLYVLAARLLRPVPAGPLPRTFIARVLRTERWRISRGGPLPYACAITAGFLYVTL